MTGNTPPRWLVIVEEDFLPAHSGGRVESLNIVAAVVASGVRTSVLIPGMTDRAAYDQRLPEADIFSVPRRTGPVSHFSLTPYLFRSRPLSAEVLDMLVRQHQADPYEVVLGASFRIAEMGRIVADTLDLPLILRPHNIESNYFRQLAMSSRFPLKLAYHAEAAKLRRAERQVHTWDRVALFADISDAEAESRRLDTTRPVIHIPPFLQLPFDLAGPERAGTGPGNTILFLGTLDNPNNVVAVEWFVAQCWPALRDTGVEFHVVGRRAPDKLVERLRAEGVVVSVNVPEIDSHLAAADVFINPVQRGAGVNIKMIDAMRAGVPVVSTTVGARGVRWRDNEQLVMADSPDEFRGAIARLLADSGERRRLANGAHQYLTDELHPVSQVAKIREQVRVMP